MLEYVNENGESYTEDEINQFAKDNNTSFDDIIAKNGLNPKKQKENVSPGKQKTVAKKDANATAPNTASKLAPTSSDSKKRKSFFDQAIETPSFEESANKAIKAKKEHSQDFIYHWLLWFEPKWVSFSQGSTFESINSDDIKSLKISVPTIKEQEKIAQVLTLADREIDLYQQQLDKFKLEKKSLMQQLLTGQKRVKLDNQKTA